MKKSVISILVSIILIASFSCIGVYGASSEAVAAVHFDLYPNTDGTLDVVETWNIEYGGTGEGFTRWIDSDSGLADLMKYDSISDVAVKINGETVSEDSTQTHYYKYGNSSDGVSFNIIITSPSAVETKEYTVSYTVNGALKKQGGDVRCSYMLIGNTFRYTCNNVTASVYMPDGVDISDMVVNDEAQVLINDSVADYNTGRVYSTFSVDISMPDDAFDTSVMPSYSALKNALKSFGQALLSVLYIVVAIAVALAVIVFTLFYEKIIRFATENKAKKSNAQAPESLPEGFSACKVYKMLDPYSRINPRHTTKKIPSLFAMAILECIEKGYIVEKDKDLIVGIPDSEEDAYLMSVLNFLIMFCEKKHNRYVITADICDKIENECMSNYDSIANYLCSFYALIPDMDSKFLKNEDNSKAYENCYLLKNAIKKDGVKCTFAQGITDVLSGAKTADKQIFAMMYTSKIFESNGRDCAAALSEAVGAMYDVFVKSK